MICPSVMYPDRSGIGWDLLADLPEAMLTRIDDKYIKVYHPKYAGTAKAAEAPKK